MKTILFILSLLINDGQVQEIQKGEPVSFQIRINAVDTQYDQDEIKALFDVLEAKKEETGFDLTAGIIDHHFIIEDEEDWSSKIKFYIFDSRTNSWNTMHWSLEKGSKHPIGPKLQSHDSLFVFADFSLSIEETERIEQGEYLVRAGIETTDPAGIVKEIFTKSIKLVFSGKRIDETKKKNLLKLCKHYIAVNDLEKALDYANLYIEKNARSVENFALLGDVFFAGKDYANALDYYMKAMSSTNEDTPHSYIEVLQLKIEQLIEIDPTLISKLNAGQGQ